MLLDDLAAALQRLQQGVEDGLGHGRRRSELADTDAGALAEHAQHGLTVRPTRRALGRPERSLPTTWPGSRRRVRSRALPLTRRVRHRRAAERDERRVEPLVLAHRGLARYAAL